MRKVSIILVLITLALGCDLSTEQETQLNNTHPIIVKYYKSLGDSVYKNRFQPISPKSSRDGLDTSEVYWTNAYQKEVKSDDSLIQVEVQITLARGYDKIDSSSTVYAIAKKNGSNWLFVEQHDYFSDYFPENLRLFNND